MPKRHGKEKGGEPLGEEVERVTHVDPPEWARYLRRLTPQRRQAWLEAIFLGTIHGGPKFKPNLLTDTRSGLLDHIVTSHSDLLPVAYEAQQAYLRGMRLNELEDKYFLPSFRQYAGKGKVKTTSGMQLRNQDEKNRMLTARLLTLRYMEELGVMDMAVCGRLWREAQRICGLSQAKKWAAGIDLADYFRKCEETFLPFDTIIPADAVRSLRQEAQGGKKQHQAKDESTTANARRNRDSEHAVETVRSGSRAGVIAALLAAGVFGYGAYRLLEPSGVRFESNGSVERVSDWDAATREQCLAEFQKLQRRIATLLAHGSVQADGKASRQLRALQRETGEWIRSLETTYKTDQELFANKRSSMAADWSRTVSILVRYERRYLPKEPGSKPSPSPTASPLSTPPPAITPRPPRETGKPPTPWPAPTRQARATSGAVHIALGKPYRARGALGHKSNPV